MEAQPGQNASALPTGPRSVALGSLESFVRMPAVDFYAKCDQLRAAIPKEWQTK